MTRYHLDRSAPTNAPLVELLEARLLLSGNGLDSPSPWGVATSAETRGQFDNYTPFMADAGVDWIRAPALWSQIQPTRNLPVNQWDFSQLEGWLTTATANGMHINSPLVYNAAWSSGQSLPTAYLQEWGTYVHETISHFNGDIDYWEIWNEAPNFTGGASAADYATVVVEAYDEGKAADPDAQLGLSIARNDLQFLRDVINAGAADHFDFIAIHPYEVADQIADGTEVQYMNLVPRIRELLREINPEKADVPIWITEVGNALTGSLNEQDQADGLVKIYTMGIAQGFERIEWFEAYGNVYDLGLLNTLSDPRKAYDALDTLTDELGNDPQYLGWTLLDTEHYAFVFEGATDTVMVTWADPGQTDTVNFGQSVTIIDPVTGNTSNTSSYSLTDSPVLVRNLPDTLISAAKANAGDLIPSRSGYDAPTEQVYVNMAAVNDQFGLHHSDADERSTAVVVDGDDARDAGLSSAQRFVIDPRFLPLDHNDITIEVTVRKKSGNPGFNLKYESLNGENKTGWTNVTSSGSWQTLTFNITDALFVNEMGVSFRLDSDSTTFSQYYIRDIRITNNDYVAPDPQHVAEAGTVSVGDEWKTVTLNQTYTDPVVVVGPAAFGGADPSTLRVRHVTSDSFQLRIDEWDYLGGGHVNETVSYVVAESGRHVLDDGTILEAGSTMLDTGFATVNYTSSFSADPVVLSSVVTERDDAAVTIRQRNVGTASFEARLQEEEAADQQHDFEQVDWIAIEQGIGSTLEADTLNVNSSWQTLTFGQSFASPPVLLASMQTQSGGDPAALRYRQLNSASAQLFVEEETSADSETGHGNEQVGYLALPVGNLSSLQASGLSQIGETGTVTANHNWTTVNLSQTYLDPVVIVSPVGFAGNEPSTVRVRNVTGSSFEVQVDEWDYLNGWHPLETLSYLVVESGRHTLEDGTALEAGLQSLNQNFTTINYSSAFAAAPVVFSQTTTTNEASAVVTRMKDATATSFAAKLQEEEAADGTHASETVAWLAIDAASGTSGGLLYEANHTGSTVTDAWSTISFAQSYANALAFFAAMQTNQGTDPAAVRYQSLSATSAQVTVEEEQSSDTETGHGAENIGYLAIATGALMAQSGGQAQAMSMTVPTPMPMSAALVSFRSEELAPLPEQRIQAAAKRPIDGPPTQPQPIDLAPYEPASPGYTPSLTGYASSPTVRPQDASASVNNTQAIFNEASWEFVLELDDETDDV